MAKQCKAGKKSRSVDIVQVWASNYFDAFDYWINLESLVLQYIVLLPVTTVKPVSA